MKTNIQKIQNCKNRYFHVTPKKNIASILGYGLIAQIGSRSREIGERVDTVFLFPNIEECNTALSSWLGEEFEEEEELLILQIDLPDNFPVYREVDSNGDDFYEAYCNCNISEEFITAIYDEAYNIIPRTLLDKNDLEQEL